MKHLLSACAVLVLLPLLVCAEPAEILIDDFDDGLAPGWGVRPFAGYNDYRVVAEQGNQVMLAESFGTASGLYFEKKIDLKQYPFLSWRWKIESTIPGGDVRFKDKDDYPARVYVVFPSWFFGKTRAINYIWANRLPQGEVVPSPFTGNSQMVAVQSGNEMAGRWVREKRNVYDDYRRIFGREPGRVGAVAIMTDSDNTGSSARAWYDDIRFSKQ